MSPRVAPAPAPAPAGRGPFRARSMSLGFGHWLLGVAAALVTAAGAPAAAGRLVTFAAADGRLLSGILVEASRRPAPAVVLVPMLGRSKDDWVPVAERLAAGDVTALAIDLPAPTLPPDGVALADWHRDVRAAVDYVGARPDVRGDALGIAGASLGANLAALAASSDARVKSVALVSPSLDYRGVRIEGAMRQFGERAALLIASLHDPYAARSVRELVKDPPGLRETRWAESAAHGTLLLAREPDLVQALVEWFQRTLA